MYVSFMSSQAIIVNEEPLYTQILLQLYRHIVPIMLHMKHI